MRRTTSFTLGEHFEGFVAREIASGRYATASEVMREALRMMEERKTKMEALRQALIEGEESGFVEDFKMSDVVAEAKKRHDAKRASQ